ncbi:glutathione S-transferase family protein [Luteithermobacter gelatinilyticus]|uniref:glutathione S-transferase family protein n=1 Tax=Luteithermobacter gelatinilyticus TaxID=2582913 RepID=UPI001105F3E6|nr:glutathione S-transferase family protein [Luteithermobacter gelatinilyticus]
MFRLFHRPDCPFCWKVRIALYELNLPFQETLVTLGEKHPEVLALNPNGTVPVLITDDGTVLWESAAILEYLVDHVQDNGAAQTLLVGSAAEKAEIRQIHIFSDNHLGKAVFPLIRHRRENPGREADPHIFERARLAWHENLGVLEKALRHRPFFGGETFSCADCALVPRVTLAEVYGLPFAKEMPQLKTWYARVGSRPSVQAARPARFPGIDDFIKPVSGKI